MLGTRANQGNFGAILALCGVSAPIVFVILITVGGFIYKGYSHVTQAVSELGGVEAQYPLLQNTNFFVIGVLFMAFAFGLHRGIGGGSGSKVGPALVGVFGVSSGIGNALLPCDPAVNSKRSQGRCTT